MKKLIFILYFFINSVMNGQDLIWEKHYYVDSLKTVLGRQLINSYDGNIFICASYNNVDLGYTNPIIFKMSKSGQLLWNTIIHEDKPIWYPQIKELENQNIVCAGNYSMFWMDFNYGGFALSLSEISKDGNLTNTNRDTSLNHVSIFDSQTILFEQNKISTVSLSNTDTALSRVMLFRNFDLNGKWISEISADTIKFLSNDKVTIKEILKTNDGGYVVYGNISIFSSSKSNGFISKYDSNYTLLWKNIYDETDNFIQKVKEINGEIHIVFKSRADFNLPDKDSTFYRILSESGTTKSIKHITSSRAFTIVDFIKMNNGITLFIGNVTMIINQTQYYALYFVGFDKYNKFVINKYIHFDLLGKSLNTIFDDKNGNIFITGNWGDSLYLAKIDYATSVQNESKKDFIKYSIFPNPASDYIEISVGAQRAVPEDIVIYNLLGIEVQKSMDSRLRGNDSHFPEASSMRIDVSHLAPGVYFVCVGDVVRKFVKY